MGEATRKYEMETYGADDGVYQAWWVENRTPHTIVLVDERGSCELKPCGVEARAASTRETLDEINVDGGNGPGFPIVRVAFGPVEGLPDFRAGTLHIVSRIAAEAARAHGRTTGDLLIPDDLVRGPDGQPVGCRGFAKL